MSNNIINIGESPVMQTGGLYSLGKKKGMPDLYTPSEMTEFYSVESPDGSVQLFPNIYYYKAQKEDIFARQEVTYVSVLLNDPNTVIDILDNKDFPDHPAATRLVVNKFSHLIDQALLFGKKGTVLFHDNLQVQLTWYG